MKVSKLVGTALASALALTAASESFAADLPSRSQPPMAYTPPPPPVFTWSGFYVGAQLGYAGTKFGQLENDFVGGFPASNSTNYTSSGIVGGGHLGFNYQMSSIVLGLEADVEGATAKGSQTFFDDAANPESVSVQNNFRGSVRGRAGVAFDRALLYATGGLAYGTFKTNLTNPLLGSETFSNTMTGYTVGGGLEYAFTPAWSARIEYRYTDFGKTSQTSAFAFPGFGYNTHVTDNSVRVGVSYHFGGFGGGSPVLAKY